MFKLESQIRFILKKNINLVPFSWPEFFTSFKKLSDPCLTYVCDWY